MHFIAKVFHENKTINYILFDMLAERISMASRDLHARDLGPRLYADRKAVWTSGPFQASHVFLVVFSVLIARCDRCMFINEFSSFISWSTILVKHSSIALCRFRLVCCHGRIGTAQPSPQTKRGTDLKAQVILDTPYHESCFQEYSPAFHA